MKQKVFAALAVFIITFLTVVLATLPYENYAVKALNRAKKQSGLKISYDSIKAGAFGADIEGLQVQNLPIGHVAVGYTPLSLITRSTDITSSGAVNGVLEISGAETSYKAEISSGLLQNISEEFSVSGSVAVEGTGNTKKQTADISALLDKITVKTPLGPLDFEKVSADIRVEGNDINIRKLTSDDSMALNLTGSIKVNSKNSAMSVIFIKGTANILGASKEIILQGTPSKLTPSIR
jgi:hypothetical protein